MIQRRVSRGEIFLAAEALADAGYTVGLVDAAVALIPGAAIALVVMSQPTRTLELTTGRVLLAVAFEIAAILVTGSILRRPGADSIGRFGSFSRQSFLAGLSLFFAWVILYYGTALVSAILFPGAPGRSAC